MKIWSTEKEQFLKENYPKHGSLFCANKLNLTQQQIRGKARLLKLYINPQQRSLLSSKANKHSNTRCGVNPQKFLQLNTPHICYILGFLWADGYLIKNTNKSQYRICVEISNKDFDNIFYIFSKVGTWTVSTIKQNKRIQISNKMIYSFLLDHDYILKSTKAPTKILNKLPNNLKQFWWRGYFDGDGCFYTNDKHYLYQASFSGSVNQDWSEVNSLLKNLQITSYKTVFTENKHGHKGSYVLITRKQNLLTLGRYLYSDLSDISLQRKKVKLYSLLRNSV